MQRFGTAPRRAVALLMLSLLLAACAGGRAQPRASGSLKPCTPRGLISVGERLPDCTFEAMFGAPAISLAALRGKPLVLNFWASWCVYCVREMPTFQTVHETLGDRVHVLGVDLLGIQAERTQDAERFARQRGARYLLAYDPGGLLYSHFGASVMRPPMPLTVFADADGVVRFRQFGPFTESELRDAVREHLGVA